jgi:hypothetical protein
MSCAILLGRAKIHSTVVGLTFAVTGIEMPDISQSHRSEQAHRH